MTDYEPKNQVKSVRLHQMESKSCHQKFSKMINKVVSSSSQKGACVENRDAPEKGLRIHVKSSKMSYSMGN